MSITKLEIVTPSKEHHTFSQTSETVKDGCVVISLLDEEFSAVTTLVNAIPLKPGEAGQKCFDEIRAEIKGLGLKVNIFVQGR